jgi:hypothetical protein
MRRRMSFLAPAFALCLFAAGEAIAQEDAAGGTGASAAAPAPDTGMPAAVKAQPDAAAQIDASKSYAIPALDIFAFDFLLNRYNRRFSGSDDYNSNLSTIRHNLRSSWVVDHDPFVINQLGHPYQGSMSTGFA